jgi:hypothetical protein
VTPAKDVTLEKSVHNLGDIHRVDGVGKDVFGLMEEGLVHQKVEKNALINLGLEAITLQF